MAIDSIENDLNMIVEEYGFWTKLTEKMKEEIVNLIFSDYIKELQPLILGCEQAFINNFVVCFAIRKYYAGQVIQYGAETCNEMFIVWTDKIAVCEDTEFEEPILLYGKGAVFNLYQILMSVFLPFNYRAVSEEEFIIGADKTAAETDLHQQRKEKVYFNEHRFKPSEF